ncbi:class I SAM-dependent methyltransferase [Actinomadura atramentaria]|uniref:class I SAM-dependent methyltransferase n=1 Tax=Actinomadura atramentaria TaxID=1990 RepID=UPI0003637A80|nr:methyltransferase [Actinomadura atramentaria]
MAHEHHAHGDDAALAKMLDLDAEVLRPVLTETTAWLAELAGDPPPARVLDLGSGPGAGTFALLDRFPAAEAVAVDAAPGMLDRLTGAARARGVADRVTAVAADLDAGWPPVGAFDLVWASASLHHVADPARVLRDVRGALRPGGLFAVLELDGFPRFLPHDLGFGRPGLEDRCHAALADRHGAELPNLGADWGPPLRDAGFAVEGERVLAIELAPPLTEAAGRYARVTLDRLRAHLADRLDADDLAALDALLTPGGPHDVRRRDDLAARGRRTAWVARRPVV